MTRRLPVRRPLARWRSTLLALTASSAPSATTSAAISKGCCSPPSNQDINPGLCRVFDTAGEFREVLIRLLCGLLFGAILYPLGRIRTPE